MSLPPDSSSLKQVFLSVLDNRNQHYQDIFNVLCLLKHIPLLRFTWCNEIQLCGRMSVQSVGADPYVISSTHKETPQLTSLLYHPLSLFPFPQALNMDTDGMASPAAQLCGTWLFTQWHLQRLIPKANQKQLIAKAFSRYLPTWRKLYWFSEGDSAVPNCLHSPPFPPLLLVTAAQ